MRQAELVRRRLASQRLVAPALAGPVEVVRWFGAVQAQDYRGALWGIGLRTRRATEAEVEGAIAERAIVRSWPMRGTLHFVAGEDLRWMLRLLAPRVIRRSAGRHRQLGLDAATFARAGRLFEDGLAGGRRLTRPEMYQLLARGGVAPDGQRGIHILGLLAMEGLLCLAAHRGKQASFALLEEWLPPAPALDRDEALAELARRYFTSHGPATAADFAWWSGLTLGEAREAIRVAGRRLTDEDGLVAAARAPARRAARSAAHLLPPYDEYTVAYRDRSAIVDPELADATRGGIFAPVVVVDGRVAGTWRRRASRGAVAIAVELAGRPRDPAAIAGAAGRCGGFLGLPVELTISARPPAAGARRRTRRP